MNTTIPRLISSIARKEPAQTLEQQVLARIRERIKAHVRTRIVLFGTGTMIGIGGIAALCSSLVRTIAQSGFFAYLALAFSGDGAVFRVWRELCMSLLESLPLVGVIGTLAALTFVIWTAANAVSNARRFGSIATA